MTSAIDGGSVPRYRITGPVLSLGEVAREAMTMEPVITDLGNGISVESRGTMIRIIGKEKLSMNGMMAAIQAAKAEGDAAKRIFATWLDTHPEEMAEGHRPWRPELGDMPPPGHGQPSRSSWQVIATESRNATLAGGAGNDFLSGYEHMTIDGGDGNDRIESYAAARITDRLGNNFVSVGLQSGVRTGGGDDWIEAGNEAEIHAGNGSNMVRAGDRSYVAAGSASDLLEAGVNSLVAAGAGDDVIKVGRGSAVRAGAGNDRIEVDGKAVIHFARGDGRDVIGGGRPGFAFQDTDKLRSSVVSFDHGISVSDLAIQRQGNDLVVEIAGGDSLTFTDVQRHGLPSLAFADGLVVSSGDFATIAGPAEAYRPASQVLQRWYDAYAVYSATQGMLSGTSAPLVSSG